MKRVEDNSYLEQRGRVWWYNRRVPRRFAHLDCRKRIKESLSTTSLEQARYKRDLLAEADDHYWASLQIAAEAGPSTNREVSEAVRRRYKMATVKALARLLAVQTQAGPQEIPKERDADAFDQHQSEIEKDLAYTYATLSHFVYYWLTRTEPIPEGERDITHALGKQRYEYFLSHNMVT